MPTSLIDLPLNGVNEKDSFNINGYQLALVDFIKGAEAPLTIALQGEWGSGKTSLMNVLKAELTQGENATYYAVEVNTWHYSMLCTPEQAIVGILRSILEQMGKKDQSKGIMFKAISGKLVTFAATASANILGQLVAVPEVGSSILEAYKSCKKGGNDLTINDILPASSIVEELKTGIKKAIDEVFPTEGNDSNGSRGFLFFIDDLDRIDPPVAVKILELLKNIFDLPRCIFVLAIDYNVVVKGLKSKFGELTAKNEREFRSFFDKIIQLPFSMPISSYKIDNFLTEKLKNIGFLDDSDDNNSKLKTDLTEFAQWSVGNNPRSLKRLMNTLSLIRLITKETGPSQDDFKNYKVLNFALVCIQNTYPAIYNALLLEPDFREWDNDIVQKFALPELPKEVADRLDKIEEFNERWEKILFRICNNDYFLSQRALEISNMLNKIIKIIPEDKNLGDCLSQIMRLSSVTNVQATERQQNIINTDFHKSSWLKAYRDRLLPKVNQILQEEEAGKVICTNDRVRTTLYFRYQKDNDNLVDNVSFSLTYDDTKKRYVANWSCGFMVFKGSTTANWDEAEREIGQTGTWDKIKSNFKILQNEYKADHDMSKSLNIGSGGSFVWFKLYCVSLEEMISPTVMEQHANFFVKFLQTAAEFKKLENTQLFEEYFLGLKNHCTEKGYAPFTNLWVYSWNDLVIDRFLYKNNVLSLDMTFDLNGFTAEFWVREGDSKIMEEILDKTDLRKEFPDIVNDRFVKHLSFQDTIQFVDMVLDKLKNLQ